ncbi:hypothetical protein ACVWZL_006044 [Bradyrhizobium sp. GM2.4]
MAETCGRSSRVRRPKTKWLKPTELGDAFYMTRNQTIATLFALATTAIAIPTSPSFAFSSEAQQMCSGDAMRLCSSEIPRHPQDQGLHGAEEGSGQPGLSRRDGPRARRRDRIAQAGSSRAIERAYLRPS